MADYSKVELGWPGKRTEVERVRLPFQVVETINESKTDREKNLLFRQKGEDPGGWRNKLIWGDNKYVMDSLLDPYAGKIGLIYIDPPFFTGTDQKIVITAGGNLPVTKEPSIIEDYAYRNIWREGPGSYMQWFRDRLVIMRGLLAENGIIFIRHDQYWSHYIKIIADEVFGKINFQNEIVVKRIFKNVTTQGRISIPIATDSLFVYFKTEEAKYIEIYKKLGKPRGSYWRALDDSAGIRKPPQREIFGEIYYPPAGKHFKFNQNKINKFIEESRIRINPKTGRPQYLVEEAGKAVLNSNWTDISGYSFTTGYPTENAGVLLERVINAGSKEGDIVADFFCGSGTTLAVAEKMNRKWIGCDLSKFAIHTTRKRLLGIEGCRPFEVLNLGLYEKHKLSANGFGHGPAYVKFVLDLYRAEALPGFAHVHGRKSSRLVHVGAVDSVITEREIRLAAGEAKEAGARGLDILGWDFEMGLHDLVDAVGDEFGVKVKLVQIPRETLEVQDARDKVKFFDLNYLEVNATASRRKVKVALKDFAIANPEYLPEEVRKSVRKFTDFIDYWAVDFDYKGDTFHNMDQAYKTRKDRTLAKSLTHSYEKARKYNILVRVVDIFGNDTTKLIKISVR